MHEPTLRSVVRVRGYTLVELLIAIALTTVVAGALFQAAASARAAFRTQPEIADMHQRLRFAADMLYKDLVIAGAGASYASDGSLGRILPPLRPTRSALEASGELAYASDEVSILYASDGRSHTRLVADQASPTAELFVDTLNPSCPPSLPCGFRRGMLALVFDATAAGQGFDVFQVTDVTGLSVLHGGTSFSKAYTQPSGRVLEVQNHTYFHDAATNRLMHHDGAGGVFPLADNVVDLRFTYYADPDPSSAPKPPPGLSTCLYDAGNPPIPRLTPLGGTELKPLTPGQLTDGPVCGLSPNRFDGDLLRVRKVRVELEVQIGSDDLRSISPYRISFDVTPRNLNLLR